MILVNSINNIIFGLYIISCLVFILCANKHEKYLNVLDTKEIIYITEKFNSTVQSIPDSLICIYRKSIIPKETKSSPNNVTKKNETVIHNTIIKKSLIIPDVKKNHSVVIVKKNLTSITGKKNKIHSSVIISEIRKVSIYDRIKQNSMLPQFGNYDVNQYDYKEIVYPIPFKQFFGNKRNRYEQFGERILLLPPYVHTGSIPRYHSDSDLLIITGSSENHFEIQMVNLLSILNATMTASIAFLDIGLSNIQLIELGKLFRYIHGMHMSVASNAQLYYRKFNFNNAPTWMNVTNPHTRGGFSWKTIGYMDYMEEWQGMGAWIDAGSLIENGVDREVRCAKLEGMYAPHSSSNIEKWTHTLSIQFLESHHMVRTVDRKKRNCSSGHFFMNFQNETVVNSVFMPFLMCAYTMRCITPNGTDRTNHRQEQAILSVLLHNANLTYSANLLTSYRAAFHMDKLSEAERQYTKKQYQTDIAHRVAQFKNYKK